MLIAVRHGPTLLDEPAAKGALQGWHSLEGLTEEGRLDAQNVTQTLRDLPIQKIFSSDIIRAIQTAEEVAGRFHMDITFQPCFRPWDVGDLAGKPFSEVKEAIFAALRAPRTKLPGGESAQNFLDRFLPAILPLIAAKQVFLVISHSHNLDVLVSLATSKGKDIDLTVMAQPCEVEPGGILVMNRDWSYTVLNPPKELIARPKRSSKASVLYLHRPKTAYQCKDCLTFIPTTKRCMVHGASDEISPLGTCGLFVQGKPMPGLFPMAAVHKSESGYMEAESPDGYSCQRCKYYLASRKDCQKVDPESDGDDPSTIEPGACCNAWEEA